MNRCCFLKGDGKRCKLKPTNDSKFCHHHAEKENEINISINENDISSITPYNKEDIDINFLHSRLSDLEKENVILKEKLKVKKNTSTENLARKLFYHDNKSRPDIIGTLEDRLKSVQLILRNKAGNVIVPWRFVKECTDLVWQNSDEVVKNEYRNKAMIIERY